MPRTKKATTTQTATAAKKNTRGVSSTNGRRKSTSAPGAAIKATSLYMQNLKLSEQAKEEQELQYTVEDVQSQFAEDLRATTRELANLQRQRANLICSTTLTSRGLSTIDQQIDACQRGIVRLEGYLVELF